MVALALLVAGVAQVLRGVGTIDGPKVEAPAITTGPATPPPAAVDPAVACDGGDSEACNRAGMAAIAAEQWTIARQRFEAGCARKHGESCKNLGVMYDHGDGVERNQVKAVGYYGQSCDAGNAVGCFNLGMARYQGAGVDRVYVVQGFVPPPPIP